MSVIANNSLGGQSCFTEEDLGHLCSLNIFFHLLSIAWMNLDLSEAKQDKQNNCDSCRTSLRAGWVR